MFRETVSINEYSEPGPTLEAFRISCVRSNVENHEALIAEVEAAVEEFVARGSDLASVGSHFQIKRNLSGDDYDVTIDVSFGGKTSVFSRIKSFFSS